MKPKLNPEDEVGINKEGWYCLRHAEGWFMGNEKGVACYRQHWLAKAALTLAIEREAGKMVWSIEIFHAGKLRPRGEHTPPLSATEAWKNLEPKTKTRKDHHT
jgi:hypothetical protein